VKVHVNDLVVYYERRKAKRTTDGTLQADMTFLAWKLERYTLVEYTTLMRDMEQFQTPVELRLHRFLTPILVNKHSLSISLTQQESE